MKVISLFSGIDGFGLAAESMGWEVAVTCEINEFAQHVLKSEFPNAYHHGDIHTLNKEIIHEQIIKRFGNTDELVLTGGFPCQPYSNAGKRLGKEDSRHLWPEMRRIIREVKPAWIIGENVSGIVSWSGGLVFEEVCAELEGEGYEVQPFTIPACAKNAPHRRDRVWFVAKRITSHSESIWRREIRDESSEEGTRHSNELPRGEHRVSGNERSSSDTESIGTQGSGADWIEESPTQVGQAISGRDNTGDLWRNFPTQSPICLGNDGFPLESLRQRLREDSDGYLGEEEIEQILAQAYSRWRKETIKAAGNAVVPQVVIELFRHIKKVMDFESLNHPNNEPA